MKNITLFIIAILISGAVFAQAPQSFSYQAIARDLSGNILANKTVSFKISILSGSASGTTVYSETHSKTTNGFGLVDLEIGRGTLVSGTFATINWGANLYFVKIEMDPNGGTAWQFLGTSQLLSVPYALYAKDVQNNNDADADASNEIQVLSKSGSTVTLSKGGGSFTDAVDDADNNPANELQLLSISGSSLSLSNGGGTVTIPGDSWGTQSVVTNVTLSGNGTTATPLGIVQSQLAPVWSKITGTPSTLAGYGITDGMGTSHPANGITSSMITNWNTAYGWGNHAGLYKSVSYLPAWSEITGKPTTTSGYGITDAVTISTDQTITGAKTFSKDLLVQGVTAGKGTNSLLWNTAFGNEALHSNNSGNGGNTAIGSSALYANTTGWYNTATGFGALSANTTGNDNTATGIGALQKNTIGVQNVGIGSHAMFNNVNGQNNTAIGREALWTNTEGTSNTAIGFRSLYSNTAGFNTASGAEALTSNTTGSKNTADGYSALFSNTTGTENTANGYRALFANTIGGRNTATGFEALFTNVTGLNNTATGERALFLNTSGGNNSAHGIYSLYNNTTGSFNTANGQSALSSNTTGNNNTASGNEALYSNTTGSLNTANGRASLYSNTTGIDNTANGDEALYSNSIGSNNTANGQKALLSNTTGGNNTANGQASLNSNTTGSDNTANGRVSLFYNTTGINNTANGSAALWANTTGSNNTANGQGALHQNIIGQENTAEGWQALFSNTTGMKNTAIGNNAGFTNTVGNNNLFIGSSAGYYETGSNKLFIDNQPRANETDARAKALIYGVFDADPANQVLTVNGRININNNNITNVATPVNDKDAVNKAYVDSLKNKIETFSLDDAYDRGRTINADKGAFEVSGTDGVLFGGTFNSGTIPATGAGTRLMWHPKKAAFRAGFVDGTQWDDANIGNYSSAMGYNTRANGANSFALGNNVSTGSRSGSFIIGDNSTTSVASNTANNQMMMRFAGGYKLHTNPSLSKFISIDSTGISIPQGELRVGRLLKIEDYDANSHTMQYENNHGYPLIYSRYLYGTYGHLVLQGLSSIYPSAIHFVTGCSAQGYDPPTERMVIMGNGNVGIGEFLTFSPPTTKLDVKGKINVNNNNITNVANPVNSKDAANKAYVDSLQINVTVLEGMINKLQNTISAGGFVTDIEGNRYNTVVIGTQTWMAENLKTTKYNDGTDIPLVADSVSWVNLTTPAYCWYNNNEATNKNIYGALFNWYTINTGKLCPTGWHAPSDIEWTTLTDFLGGLNVAGGKLKEAGKSHWKSPNTGATNESGFSGLPAGYRAYSAGYLDLLHIGDFWSSTIYPLWNAALDRILASNIASVYIGNPPNRKDGKSVRCVKD
jgi:trimeric autotransporter adhesin